MAEIRATLETCYTKAIDTLIMNSTKLGFSATLEKSSNYYSVWARDHSIASIAAVLSKNEELINTSKKGLLLLLKRQKDHGQVPSYIEIENRKISYGGLGIITSVDSNMWVIISSAILYKKTSDKRFVSPQNMVRYQRIYRLFKAFDSNDCGLIEVPKAGDWADVFNRTYHVLYDECLYYLALKALLFLFNEGLKSVKDDYSIKKIRRRIRWISQRKAQIKKKINFYFWFSKDNMSRVLEEYMIFEKIPEEDYSYYQSHLMPFKLHWHKRFETFGNVLAIVSNIANKEKKRKIIHYIIMNKINEPFAIKCLHPPVYKKEKGWENIYELRERPHTFHNGGIWPVIAGFWIYALAKNHFRRHAIKDLFRLAKALEKQDWTFNEYMHGKTGKPLGHKYQAWSAAGYIIGYHSVYSNINIFDV